MSITIIPSEGMVSIDNDPFFNLDMSSVASDIHAVQWNGQMGEIEYVVAEDGTKPANRTITSMDTFSAVIEEWGKAKAAASVVPTPTPNELRTQFDRAVTTHLDAFASTPYADNEQPFDSMDKARLASLTTDYKQWGDIANRLYDQTWKAAEALVPEIMDGTLTIEAALDKLPALSWEETTP